MEPAEKRTALSQTDLERIYLRWSKTTPGSWISYVEGRDHTCGSNFISTGEEHERGPDIELTGASNEDQDFIAAAHQDVPRLLAEIQRLKSQI